MGMKVPTDKDKAGRRSQRMQGVENGSEDSSLDSSMIKKEDLEESVDDKANVQQDKIAETKFSGTNSFSKELARLQFFGAGPKMAGLPSMKSKAEKTRGVKINFEYDPVSKMT